jgi:hypothetical protein
VFVLEQDYAGPEREFLVDVGTSDNFLKEHLEAGELHDSSRGDLQIESQ